MNLNIEIERFIAAPPEQVFDVVTDSDNLAFSSLVVRVRRTREGRTPGWSLGAVREVTAIGAWFSEEITAVERPTTFGYRILRSVPPFEHDGGTIEVTPAPGGSRVAWRSRGEIPIYLGGTATAALAKWVFERIFGQILDRAAKVLEQR